ncbi:hypothetical protein CAPTEDRAFT_221034 [Capitella teleta]|uniref:Neurotransmitter-gated ion-channel ligand-binding domain-containing protein n=1 Tax=Capitella teleta TaxID=283909 RepID=R7T723_CAPTE|nr:hypothetical protein CAPTEDRAFT_221034 [Capitella teleta]|eukprot:ELT89429.1 hypothetical protein CAPTEDRAFT_221034 [Capitella teleta]
MSSLRCCIRILGIIACLSIIWRKIIDAIKDANAFKGIEHFLLEEKNEGISCLDARAQILDCMREMCRIDSKVFISDRTAEENNLIKIDENIGEILVSCGKEQQLVNDLVNSKQSAGVHGRPGVNPSSPIQVNISLSILQILEYDQDKEVIVLIGRTALEWFDSEVTWNASKYDDIDLVVIDHDALWTPDIIVLGLVQPAVLIHQSRLRVTSQGNITWVQESRYHVNCKPPSSEDSPTCNLRFGSMAYDETKLLLSSPLNLIDAGSYVPNSIWEFSKNKVLKESRSMLFLTGTIYDDVMFQFKLRRRPTTKSKEDEEESGASSILPSAAAAAPALLVLLLTR